MSSSRRGTPEPDGDLRDSPFAGDLEAELTPRASRTPRLTMVLGAGVLLVAGMVIGIQVQKTFGGRAAAMQALLAGGGGAMGTQGTGDPRQRGAAPGRQAGGVTFGTVQLVDGRKIYLRTPAGETLVVTTTGDTKVRISEEGAVGDIKPGSTVLVQGERGEDGTVAATTVDQGGLGGRGAVSVP